MQNIYDVAVIGAGISGLAAANVFSREDLRVCVFEKSRGLGGRTSTRRWGSSESFTRADLGAQFTYARNPGWQDFVTSQEGMRRPASDTDLERERFIHPEGMSRFAKSLFDFSPRPLEVRFETRVIRVERLPDDGGAWLLSCETPSGTSIFSKARNLVIALPLPQAIDLIDQSREKSKSDSVTLAKLRNIPYSRCIAFVGIAKASENFHGPGILEVKCSTENLGITGIFDQNEKGLHSGKSTLVIHTTPEFSLANWEVQQEVLAEKIWANACSLLRLIGKSPFRATPEVRVVHRWKFARPERFYPDGFAKVDDLGHSIGVCGDAFAFGGMDGAFASGEALARGFFRGVIV
ncbi:MAG: NAD(P)-binding protein [Cryobacterium sp.]|nr:NAD(P)-binding protein [Oligoflexia bacterium]